MTGSNTIVYRDGFGDIREEEVPAKDYSNAPVLIQLGGQNMFFAIVVGGMLFYGALKK